MLLIQSLQSIIGSTFFDHLARKPGGRYVYKTSLQQIDVLKIHGDLSAEVYDDLIEGARERNLRITGHAQHLLPLAQSLRMDSIEHIEEFLYVSRDPAFRKSAAGSIDNYFRAYTSNLHTLANAEHRAAVVSDVAASGIYVSPTLIIYKYIQTYLADDQFAALREDARLAYLPHSIREEYLDAGTNEYRKGLAAEFRKHLGAGTPLDQHFASNVELLSKLLFEMHQAGVPLLLATDSFGAVVPGYSVHQELELLVAAGLTPYEALRTGTVNVAAYLGESENAGTVEVGKRADFILVESNPLADVGHASAVHGVFSRGQWHSQSDIADLLSQAKELASDLSP